MPSMYNIYYTTTKKMSQPGFIAFLQLKKVIASELGIANGPKTSEIAGNIIMEMKKEHVGKSIDDIISIHATQHFLANISNYTGEGQ